MDLRDIQHGLRVAYILVVVASVALIVRARLIPPTFGLYGTYRGAAVREIMDSPVRYRGVENCKSCHLDQWAEWRKSAHKTIACESCHGPGMEHSEPDIDPRPKIFGVKELMVKSRDLCLSCHAKAPGRPVDFPQVDSDLHPPRHSAPTLTAEVSADRAAEGPEQAVRGDPLPWTYSCMFCHGDAEIFSGDRQHLLVREADLLDDIHWRKGLQCHDCHGGNPVLGEFTPHEDDPNFRNVKSPEDAPEFCGRCHFDAEYMGRYQPLANMAELTEYLMLRHGRRRNGEGGRREAPCVSCHGFHAIRSLEDLGKPDTCVPCHNGHDPARLMPLF